MMNRRYYQILSAAILMLLNLSHLSLAQTDEKLYNINDFHTKWFWTRPKEGSHLIL